MEHIDLALTFDDVLLVPARSDVLPCDVNLQTLFTKKLSINIPLISAAMDTVTESKAAICMAQQGGIGVIHRNLTPSMQAKEVTRVKNHKIVIIHDPITVKKTAKVSDALCLMKEHSISGIPVVDFDRVVGIVTSRDLRFEKNIDTPIRQVMTPENKLVTISEGASSKEIESLLHKHRIEKIVVVKNKNKLRGLVTLKDIQKLTNYPNACRDKEGRLMVAAAIGVGLDSEERIERLIQAQVDAVVVDTAHGHSSEVINRIKKIKQKYGNIQVVGGNIATFEAAQELVEAGVDAVKVGIGPGSICTTRIIAGVGVPQIHALQEVSKGLEGTEVPLIADGGIRYSGDIAKCLAAGAHCVMGGRILSGTDESPGEIDRYQGLPYKSYRGMGSIGAMKKGSKDRYFQDGVEGLDRLISEGIEGRVPYKGPMINIIHQLMGGLRASMGYTGSHNISEMRTTAQFIRITNAGMRESHVHDVAIVKEEPNYHP